MNIGSSNEVVVVKWVPGPGTGDWIIVTADGGVWDKGPSVKHGNPEYEGTGRTWGSISRDGRRVRYSEGR